MGDRLAFALGYGTLFVVTALWLVHRFLLQDRDKVALAAEGGSALAAVFLSMGLVLRGFRLGYWPLHTANELLTVGLLGLVLASLTLLSPRRDGLLPPILSVTSSLVALYGLLFGVDPEPVTLAYDSGWWAAYVILCGFGGGSLVAAGVAAVLAHRKKSKALAGERALSWSLLTLSTGLAAGVWSFQRLWGRSWGDARWVGIVIVWLMTVAAWHGRKAWSGQGWRSALVGVILGLAGSYVVLGLGSVG